jgi:hypothetical protein
MCWHKWEKWQDFKAEMVRSNNTVYTCIMQLRHCLKCNKKQTRHVE